MVSFFSSKQGIFHWGEWKPQMLSTIYSWAVYLAFQILPRFITVPPGLKSSYLTYCTEQKSQNFPL